MYDSTYVKYLNRRDRKQIRGYQGLWVEETLMVRVSVWKDERLVKDYLEINSNDDCTK